MYVILFWSENNSKMFHLNRFFFNILMLVIMSSAAPRSQQREFAMPSPSDVQLLASRAVGQAQTFLKDLDGLGP